MDPQQNNVWLGQLGIVLEQLGWEANDDIVVEVGGTVVSGIHQPITANPRWSTPFGARKYNKDAFIVIKNRTRDPMVFSEPNPDLKAHHLKTEEELAAEVKKQDDEAMYDTSSK